MSLQWWCHGRYSFNMNKYWPLLGPFCFFPNNQKYSLVSHVSIIRHLKCPASLVAPRTIRYSLCIKNKLKNPISLHTYRFIIVSSYQKKLAKQVELSQCFWLQWSYSKYFADHKDLFDIATKFIHWIITLQCNWK